MNINYYIWEQLFSPSKSILLVVALKAELHISKLEQSHDPQSAVLYVQ